MISFQIISERFFSMLGDSAIRVLSFISESCDFTKLAMEFYL